MVFRSQYPDIDIPRQTTAWSFLFDRIPLLEESVAAASNNEPPYAPLSPTTSSVSVAPDSLSSRGAGGFTNALTGARISHPELKLRATWLSTALARKLGMGVGDVVAIISPNTVSYPVILFAVLRIGGVVSCASPAYNADELEYVLKTSGAKYLFAHADALGVAMRASIKVGLEQKNVVMLDGQAAVVGVGHETVEELVQYGRSCGDWSRWKRKRHQKETASESDNNSEKKGVIGQVGEFRIPRGKTNADVCGYLSFSSGTTGLPKAVRDILIPVRSSHGNVIAQCLQMKQLTRYMHAALAVLPLFHITGLIHLLHTPLMFNAEVYMLPYFEMKLMLDTVVKYRLTELILVPPLLLRLVRDPIAAKYDLSHVTEFGSGAAPLSQEIVAQLKERYPNARGVRQGYGMTESTSCITLIPRDDVDFEHGSTVGKIVGSTTVKFVDSSGKEMGVGQVGEILAKGPQISMGYLNNPSATASTYDSDGYLHTGDIGHITSDGYIVISDRLKELIKVKGVGVAPAELEDCLLGHPAVEDAAVLGVPDDYSGEKPKAYIVLKEAEKQKARSIMEKSICDWVKERKDRNKWLEGGLEFVEEVPKSASGKIIRKKLKEMEKERRATAPNNTVRSKL